MSPNASTADVQCFALVIPRQVLPGQGSESFPECFLPRREQIPCVDEIAGYEKKHVREDCQIEKKNRQGANDHSEDGRSENNL